MEENPGAVKCLLVIMADYRLHILSDFSMLNVKRRVHERELVAASLFSSTLYPVTFTL